MFGNIKFGETLDTKEALDFIVQIDKCGVRGTKPTFFKYKT